MRFGQTSSAWWRHLREGVDGDTTVDAACSLSELRCTHESSYGRYVYAISEDPAPLKLTAVLLEVKGFTDAPPPSAVVAAHHSAGDADHH